MLPHFKTQARMRHVMRRRLHTPTRRSRVFFLGYRSRTALVAVGAGTIVLLIAECRARRSAKIEEKAFLESGQIIRADPAHFAPAGTERTPK